MKRILQIFLSLVLVLWAVVSLSANANAAEIVDSGSCGGEGVNVTWSLDSDGLLTISGTGDMRDYNDYSSPAPWYGQRTGIKSVVIESGVTSIGDYAFRNCSRLTSVTIPDSVTSIGARAFNSCSSLTSVTIPDSVTSIGARAFNSCSSLTSVTIPDSVTSIGKYAFSSCSSLEGIWVEEDNSAYDSDEKGILFNKDKTELIQAPGAITGEVTVPEGVTSIGEHAFSSCSSLKSITIPESVTSIGDGALSGCSGLESITIPFVGGSRKTESDTYQYPFGYIFGTGSYAGGVQTRQYYYGYSTSSTTYDYFYIPASLKTVTVTEGNILYGAFYNCSSLTSITIPDSVTSIGDRAFYYCSSLTSVTIPDSVTSIGSCAFSSCSSLTSVTIPDSVTSIGYGAFDDCNIEKLIIADGSSTVTSAMVISEHSLKEVTIPSSVTSIGDYAFYECSSLKSITIPDSVTSIGSFAFYNCSSLKSITIPDSVTSIGYGAFDDCNIEKLIIADGSSTVTSVMVICKHSLKEVIIPSSVTSIGDDAFYECSSLTSVTIPDSVTSIGDDAFYECSSLTSVTIPDSVTSIGEYAFMHCSSLTDVYITDIAAWLSISFDYSNPLTANNMEKKLYLNGTLLRELIIPDSVTSIGYYAFGDCSSLTSVTIPDSVTSIGDFAFYNCSSLTSITIPDSVTSIGYCAFRNCSSLTSVTIPDSVTSIDYPAFDDCYIEKLIIADGSSTVTSVMVISEHSLKEVTIPSSVTSIGDSAFSYCSSLTSVTIPDSVTSIGDDAFYECSSLTSVTSGNGVTSIGEDAFYNCSSLKSITIPDSVTSIGDYAFRNCSSLTDVYITDVAAWLSISFDSSFDNYYSNPLRANNKGKKLYLNGTLLRELIIPDSVTSIGWYAFYNCSSLTSVTIPDSVTSIGDYAFSSCSSLTDVYITDVAAWLSISFGDYSNPLTANYMEKKLYLNGTLLKELIIPDSVTSIGYYAFRNCSSLKSITIPESVTSISYSAFDGCKNIRDAYYGGGSSTWYDIGGNDIDADYVHLSCAKPDGHWKNTEFVTCTEDTYTADVCPCGHTRNRQVTGSAPGHKWKEATCTTPKTCSVCKATEGSAAGHKWNNATCTTPKTCSVCKVTEGVAKEHSYADGKCGVCGTTDPNYKEPEKPTEPAPEEPTVPNEPTTPEEPTTPNEPTTPENPATPSVSGINRLAGSTRYKTAFAAADELKKINGVAKFDTIIVSSGEQFADALAGSYLAAAKNAPILLVKDSTVKAVKEYINANLNPGGTVYLLGGKVAVPEKMETGLEGFNVKRLGGNTRYDTNLLILQEAGVAGKDIVVCTGKDFADSLSASAVGLPILLVKDSLNSAQKEFLSGNTGKIFVIGGVNAVGEKAEKQLAAYGNVTRLAGATRYKTSVLVAETFFGNPNSAVIAYGENFPDGLSGGPVAYALKSPLILTREGREKDAAAYITAKGIQSGYIQGGTTVLPEKTVNKVFGK